MFRKYHQGRRPTNIVFVIFRLVLSLTMFVVLLVGIYSAYKHFSGLDPLKIDPQAVLSELLAGRMPEGMLNGLLNQTNQALSGQKKKEEPNPDVGSSGNETSLTKADLAFRFLLFADSHSDNLNLQRAINQAKQAYPDLEFIIGLGDYTEVGTVQELKEAKNELDKSGLRYFLLPGDHDLWDCRNREVTPTSCFKEVFGPVYQVFTYDNFEFLLLNNSDNYIGFDPEQLQWITKELEKGKQSGVKGFFVFLHEPLYHPSSDHVMGRVEKSLQSQAEQLTFKLKDRGVTKIFAGDVHFFSEYLEPKTNMSMMTIGATTIEKNPQAPRFAVVSVFDDGTTSVEDVEIK